MPPGTPGRSRVWETSAATVASERVEELKRRQPLRSVPIHRELRREVLLDECKTLLQDILNETKCTVIAYWERQPGSRIERFDVFGGGPGLAQAVSMLNDWIGRSEKSKYAAKWAKTPSFNQERCFDEILSKEEAAHVQMYKEKPPAMGKDGSELHKAAVVWPEILVDEGRRPRDQLGKRLEKLDKIRLEEEVWITLHEERDEPAYIEITGNVEASIQKAKDRILTVLEKMQTDEEGLEFTLNVILDSREGTVVRAEKADDWWPLDPQNYIVPFLQPSSNRKLDPRGRYLTESLEDSQLYQIERSFKHALENVCCRSGTYDLSIRLGCLAIPLKALRTDIVGFNYPRESFLRDINGKIPLNVRKWLLNNDKGTQLLRRLKAAEHLLGPVQTTGSFSSGTASLEEMRPMLRATWVFTDPTITTRDSSQSGRSSVPSKDRKLIPPAQSLTRPSPSTYVVQVDWTYDEYTGYERSAPRYYATPQNRGAPRESMHINLLELGQRRGWHFALESLETVPSRLIHPLITEFAEGVELRHGYEASSSEPFAQWKSSPSITQYMFNSRCEAIYSFGIKGTYYNVEWTKAWYAREKHPVWSLSVRHAEWASILADLEALGIGCRVHWGDTLSKFVPDNGQDPLYDDENAQKSDLGIASLTLGEGLVQTPRNGIRILVGKLMELSKIVGSISAEGRVSVATARKGGAK